MASGLQSPQVDIFVSHHAAAQNDSYSMLSMSALFILACFLAASSSISSSTVWPSNWPSPEEQKEVNEEYKIWKKNCPFLYDLVMIHALEWPSLTVQWLPESRRADDRDHIIDSYHLSQEDPSLSYDYDIHRLLLGTHTNDGEGNYLMVAEVRLPAVSATPTNNDIVNKPGYGGVYGHLEIVSAINHSGEINRARYMPGNSRIIATKPPSSEVLIFDRALHVDKPNRSAPCKPDIRLLGHEKEGYGLQWSNTQQGLLLSGSEDSLICIWDVVGGLTKKGNTSSSNTTGEGVTMSALSTYRGHTDCVEDVAWHAQHSHIFASCGDDRQIMIWDTRVKANTQATQSVEAHLREVNCLSFNPFNPHLLLSGSADYTLALFDLRNLQHKLHSFEHHRDQIFSCVWSPFSPTIFASGSGDRRVNVWDVSKIGEEQTAEDAEDGPPELLFIHAGHTDKVGDISWLETGNNLIQQYNKNEDNDNTAEAKESKDSKDSSSNRSPTVSGLDEWVIASVADDNILQIWAMAENIYLEESAAEKEKRITDEQLE